MPNLNVWSNKSGQYVKVCMVLDPTCLLPLCLSELNVRPAVPIHGSHAEFRLGVVESYGRVNVTRFAGYHLVNGKCVAADLGHWKLYVARFDANKNELVCFMLPAGGLGPAAAPAPPSPPAAPPLRPPARSSPPPPLGGSGGPMRHARGGRVAGGKASEERPCQLCVRSPRVILRGVLPGDAPGPTRGHTCVTRQRAHPVSCGRETDLLLLCPARGAVAWRRRESVHGRHRERADERASCTSVQDRL